MTFCAFFTHFFVQLCCVDKTFKQILDTNTLLINMRNIYVTSVVVDSANNYLSIYLYIRAVVDKPLVTVYVLKTIKTRLEIVYLRWGNK